jgi:hypothetical protein
LTVTVHSRGIAFVLFVAIGMDANCSSFGSCYRDIDFGADVTGYSNAACTLTVTLPDGTSKSFAIAAPVPPVAPTPADTNRAPLDNGAWCQYADADHNASIIPTNSEVVCRTSSSLSVQFTSLGPCDEADGGTESLTLTCAGDVLYDNVPWGSCACGL